MPLPLRLFASSGRRQSSAHRLIPNSHSYGYVSDLSTTFRSLSVKELSWCAPKSSPNRTGSDTHNRLTERHKEQTNDRPIEQRQDATDSPNMPEPIDKFGIVAAMSRNRIIGVNGKIPWPRSPQDRDNFKALTRDKLMIIGRKTYQEDAQLRHIDHTKWCIVVSKSIASANELESQRRRYAPNTQLEVAESLTDALGLARELLKTESEKSDQSDDTIQCWVAGGERLYEEALKHPSAEEIHLSTIHLDISVDVGDEKNTYQSAAAAATGTNAGPQYAMFPAKHRWDRRFEVVSRVEGGGPILEDSNPPFFTYVTYKRKK